MAQNIDSTSMMMDLYKQRQFNNMDYSRIYINLIERSFERDITGYVEKHHTIPRCMGGDDKARNIAILTAPEHYIVHQLLVKIYPENKKLIRAAIMMGGTRSTNKLYGWLRQRYSDSKKGIPVIVKGSSLSDEHKHKISESNKGKVVSIETRIKMSKSKTGQPSPNKGATFSIEHRTNLSKSHKGKTQSLETIEKRRATKKLNIELGITKKYKASDETKLKISEMMMGRPSPRKGVIVSDETKQKMSESRKGKIPWNKGLKQSTGHVAKSVAGKKLNRELKLQQLNNLN